MLDSSVFSNLYLQNPPKLEEAFQVLVGDVHRYQITGKLYCNININYYYSVVRFEGIAGTSLLILLARDVKPFIQPPKSWIMLRRCRLGVLSVLGPFTSEQVAVRLQERTGQPGG